MTFSISKLQRAEKDLLADKKGFYEALGRAEPAAIRALASKISYDVRKSAKRAKLTAEDTEELLSDAVFITITNIQKQTFQFADFSPAAYANGVVRKLIANRLRIKKLEQEAFDDEAHLSEFDPESYLNRKELESIMGKLLGSLGENCQQLLRLKYFDNLRDKEVVEQELTLYTSTTSLKSKRNQCLNKLIEKAKEAGLLQYFQRAFKQ